MWYLLIGGNVVDVKGVAEQYDNENLPYDLYISKGKLNNKKITKRGVGNPTPLLAARGAASRADTYPAEDC